MNFDQMVEDDYGTEWLLNQLRRRQNAMTLNDKSDKIKVKGYLGTWYVIDSSDEFGPKLFLLESEEDGDEAAHLIVDEQANPVWDGCYNDWDDLKDSLNDGTVEIAQDAKSGEWAILRDVRWKGMFG